MRTTGRGQLVTGITASLVDAAGWNGNLNRDFCLFEIDEAALPLVAKEVRLNSIVVTNLFRDQLDRFGELDTTANLINKGIGINQSQAIFDADDPNVAQLGVQSQRIFYGIKNLAHEQQAGEQQLQNWQQKWRTRSRRAGIVLLRRLWQ